MEDHAKPLFASDDAPVVLFDHGRRIDGTHE
jgi:hypothetical protein